MVAITMFSMRELRDIIIAVIALSFVFSYPEAFANPIFYIYALFAVGIAFIGHELSHRYVAQTLGYFAEFRLWRQGIFFALLMAFVTGGAFVFAAPGAVVFSPRSAFTSPTKRDIGLIGIAGVTFNLILMSILLGLNFLFPNPILAIAAFINAWLALFNMIPMGPFDGKKVLSWNPVVWAAATALALAGVLAYFFLF